MSFTSENHTASPANEVISLRAVTGRLQRRFSSPALPTQQICLGADPHDASLILRPMERLVEECPSIKNVRERWASLRARAAYVLEHPPVNLAFAQAMRLENLTRASLQNAVASRALPMRVQRPTRRESACQGARSSRMPQTLRYAQPSGSARGWTHPHVGYSGQPGAMMSGSKSSMTTESDSRRVKEENALPAENETPAATTARADSPARITVTDAPGFGALGPDPSLPGSRDIAEETVWEGIAGKRQAENDRDSGVGSRGSEDSNLGRSAAPATVAMPHATPLACRAESPHNDEVALAEDCDSDGDFATYLAYQASLTQPERSVSRGRSRRREER